MERKLREGEPREDSVTDDAGDDQITLCMSWRNQVLMSSQSVNTFPWWNFSPIRSSFCRSDVAISPPKNMDHYTVLGLRKDATKEEIKQAFRKLAMKFHPDKHSESSKTVKEGANRKFRQVSEAYEVLIDDRKRADYNLRHGAFNKYGGSGRSGYGYGYRHGGNAYGQSRYTYTPSSSSGYGDGFRAKFEIAVRFLTTRAFLLNVAFGSALLGGMVVIDFGRQSLWKTRNSGKSFEEAMESIEKAKSAKDV